MDLVQTVVQSLKVDEGKAEKGIGAILMALRTSVDRDTFDRVKDALPNSERLMGRSLMSAARTGEMMAAGPKGLMAALAAAGFGQTDVPQLGRIVTDHLRTVIGDTKTDEFLAAAPALKG